jgi:transposase-like protein
MPSVLESPFFHDEEAAYAKLESIVWPNGPVCPHCKGTERISKMQGKATRLGLHKCYACRKQFRVTVGTVFESSHIPVHLWLQAAYLMCSSKKGISSHQLARTLDITVKSAWFMSHRLREAMRSGSLAPVGGSNGVNGIVEADETFIGREPGMPVRRAYHHKMKVLSLLDRDAGQVRSVVVDDLKPDTIVPILKENIAKEASLFTDEAGVYIKAAPSFVEHQTVAHGQDEYVRGIVHTNTVEGYFSVFKRGMKGVYQHCAKKHLHRYLAEFDFRYNNRSKLGVDDVSRSASALRGIVGKRLTYKTANLVA